MEWIRSWIAGISAVVLIVSVISVIAPKNTAGRVVSMLGSIGDAIQKINSSLPDYLTEEKILEMTGI